MNVDVNVNVITNVTLDLETKEKVELINLGLRMKWERVYWEFWIGLRSRGSFSEPNAKADTQVGL